MEEICLKKHSRNMWNIYKIPKSEGNYRQYNESLNWATAEIRMSEKLAKNIKMIIGFCVQMLKVS